MNQIEKRLFKLEAEHPADQIRLVIRRMIQAGTTPQTEYIGARLMHTNEVIRRHLRESYEDFKGRLLQLAESQPKGSVLRVVLLSEKDKP